MGTGKEHTQAWNFGRFLFLFIFLLIFTQLAISFNIVTSFYVLIGCIIGYELGRYISPDLDLIGITDSESNMMKTFGIIGTFMVGWWLPYAYIMRFVGIGKKGHRNFFSHFPIISTFIRLVWLLLVPTLLLWWFYYIPDEIWLLYLGLLIGLSFADAVHFIIDL